MSPKTLAKKLVLSYQFSLFLMQLFREIFKIKRYFGGDQTIRGLSWIKRGFDSPAPNFVKWNLMRRWGSAGTWVETGTYLGETTNYLSTFASSVISIEPSKELAENAIVQFEKSKNITIVFGTSEKVLDQVLSRLNLGEARDLNFWLDGHYSAGNTYMGDLECPVPEELETIEKYINPDFQLSIMIDDVRAFSPTGETRSGYPSLSFLANWADMHDLYWTIEHDIFIMTNRVQDK